MNNPDNLNWYGNLTIDNIEQVVGLLRKLLAGKKYTFVSVNEYFGYKPEVRTGQEIEPQKATNKDAFSFWYDKDNAPPLYAGFNVVDTHGVWGLSTSATEQPYLRFEWNKVAIEHKAPAGHKMFWVVAVEGDL